MKFYTYAHYTADSKELFYIGKGQNKRYLQQYSRSLWWKSKVKKHGGFEAKILATWETEQDAFEHEKLLISIFKKQLVNLCDGGQGISGHVKSQESKNKVRNALKGKSLSKQRRKNISNSLKGRKLSQEHVKKLSVILEKLREKQKKKILCLTTQEVFLSVMDASRATGIDPSSIVKACKGILKKPGGKEFAYDES